ncbi:hypothetical protein [Acinetobacter guillouiae]|uniref:Phage antitermination protein Q n=1 Tax=Acinetobacter guillouiae NIPH 991 TaxID=1217656 RepID=N8X3C2_ACIGI|nr:hypothetical protein [Acinetobacter guillouiae]ENV18756.1 hypothetical protein F964_00556 [Acinetobacter guillouiae NIPH 991]
MNAVANRKHFSVAINWAENPIEWHLEQYGSWLLLDENYVSLGASSVLGHLIDTANGVCVDKRERVAPRCKINDAHADAVSDMLVTLMKNENNKVQKWLKVVIMFYVEFKTEKTIARNLDISEFSVARDKMLGLVRLATKYQFRSRIIGA